MVAAGTRARLELTRGPAGVKMRASRALAHGAAPQANAQKTMLGKRLTGSANRTTLATIGRAANHPRSINTTAQIEGKAAMHNLDIDALVPHRRPLRLIDEIVAVSQESAETAAVVSEDWPTVTAGAAHVLVLIELVAQTAAVIGGYQALMNPNGARPHKGMLVGIKQAVFAAERLPVGTRIVTRASTRPLMENFKQIDGVALIDDRVVGEMALQGVQME